MNSRTVAVIVAFGGLGLFALIIAALMGTTKLAEKPLVRVCIAVAEKHRVTEVTCDLVPADKARTIRLGYTTSVLYPSLDSQRDEMETIARTAWEQVDRMERETLRRDQRLALGPIRKVDIRRTWRSERGCFKRSSQATHDWTPPEAPPERNSRG